MTTRRHTAVLVVVLGYALAALGSLTQFLWLTSQGYLRISSKGDVELFATVVASLANVAAWWFLTQVFAEGDDHPLARRAFSALGVQALMLATSQILVVVNLPNLAWSIVAIWAFGVGSLVSAIGFFVMASSYPRAKRTDAATEDDVAPS